MLSRAHERPANWPNVERCDGCGWSGSPNRTKTGDTFCPRCQVDEWHEAQAHVKDVGRNDPCPCDSGKKAKKCCLR